MIHQSMGRPGAKGKSDLRAGQLLPVVFFFSGAAALGYQVVWSKAFSAGIGHEYPAVLAIVTAFMAGMGLGAGCFKVLPARFRDDPRCYAWLELIIGTWGIVSALAIPRLNGFILRLLGPNPAPAYHWTVVFGAAFVALLPATTAMGATLPPLERLLTVSLRKSTTALLYAANTAGAVAGAVSAPFWLIPSAGIRNSILIFAGVNVACGLAALWLVRPKAVVITQAVNTNSDRMVAVRLVVTGLLGLGFETVVIRELSYTLENTVYTFAIVLAVYLAGTALGSAIYQRIARTRPLPAPLLLFSLALACFLAGALMRFIPGLYQAARTRFGDSLLAVASAEALSATVIFLAPALIMGATFSSLAQQSLSFRPNLSWSVCLNMIGGAISPILFGLIIIPAFGLKPALACIAIGYVLLLGKAKMALAAPVLLLATPLLTNSLELQQRDNQKLIFFKEGAMASATVLEDSHGQRVLKVNNRFQMGGTAARLAEERHADLPLLLHPNPHRALFIGLGTGITFSTAANYTDLTADGVELLPEVAEAMRFFQEGSIWPENPNLRVHIADGRRFVLTNTNRYDVIVADLFHPAQDGAGFLYTKENFTAIRACLADNGLFCQWLPVYQMDLFTLAIVMKTFATVFPKPELWLLRFNVDTPVVGLIGWKSDPVFRENAVEEKARASGALHDHLRRIGIADSVRLFGCYVGEISNLPMLQNSVLNTDDNPRVIFRAPALVFRRRDDPGERLLQLLANFPAPGDPLRNRGLRPEFEKQVTLYIQARNIYLHGLEEEEHRKPIDALAAYIQSARISSEFTAGYAQALAIATTLARSNPGAAERILRDLTDAQPNRPAARELLDRLQN